MGEGKVRILDGNPDQTRLGPPHRWPWLLTVAGVVLGAVGALVLSSVGASGGDELSSSSVPPTEPTTSVGTVASSTTTAATSTVITKTSLPVTLGEPNVVPGDGADNLLGAVALTPSPGGAGSGLLYVLRPGGSVVRRDDVPFAPGDHPYPLLMTGGKIVFADGQSGYLVDADLLGSPEQLIDASFILPAATPGQIWLIGRGVEWVAPVDVATQDVGDRVEVGTVFDWPLAAAADGLIVRPIDEAAYGPIAYWTPGGGLDPIALDNPDKSHLIAASGGVAVIVEQDYVRVLDFTTGDYLGLPGVVAGGDRLNIEACLSPDQHYVRGGWSDRRRLHHGSQHRGRLAPHGRPPIPTRYRLDRHRPACLHRRHRHWNNRASNQRVHRPTPHRGRPCRIPHPLATGRRRKRVLTYSCGRTWLWQRAGAARPLLDPAHGYGHLFPSAAEEHAGCLDAVHRRMQTPETPGISIA